MMTNDPCLLYIVRVISQAIEFPSSGRPRPVLHSTQYTVHTISQERDIKIHTLTHAHTTNETGMKYVQVI